jgi:hypothetical protein
MFSLGGTSNNNEEDYYAFIEWSKNIPAIKSEDQRRLNTIIHKPNNQTLDGIREQFFSYINMPLQSVCNVGKFFGGQWLDGCGGMDGHKFVCLDKLYADVQSGNCLIYSFGIADDWTFEEAMAELGCTIRAFDPTIDGSTKPNYDQVKPHFFILNFLFSHLMFNL